MKLRFPPPVLPELFDLMVRDCIFEDTDCRGFCSMVEQEMGELSQIKLEAPYFSNNLII